MLARGRIMGGRLPVSIRLGEMTTERGAISRLLIYDLMAFVQVIKKVSRKLGLSKQKLSTNIFPLPAK